MHSIRQLSRQPIKALLGIALIASAVAAICVCLGMGVAAMKTESLLNTMFQTAVLPSTQYTDEADNWALRFAHENPEVVKTISIPGLASAYVSNLIPDNYTAYFHSSENWDYITQPYDCAMLEITLIEISEPAPIQLSMEARNEFGVPAELEQNGFSVQLVGIINNVIGLKDDYQNCAGFHARLTLEVPCAEIFEELDLEIGERYLVYCTEYQDDDYLLRSGLCRTLAIGELKEWHNFQKIEFFSLEEIQNHNSDGSYYKKVGRVRIGDNITYIYDYQIPMYLSVTGTISNPAVMPQIKFVPDEGGQQGETMLDYLGSEYTHPTIVRLSGTAEEYLASEEGLIWREALQNININNHSFPVIGVDNLSYIADFLRGSANIEIGRSFTDNEIDNGSNVCVISDTLARNNGLTIGDTIDLQFYDNDENLPYQINISTGSGNTNPTANYYFANTTPLYEAETYTIVGIYNRGADWVASEENLYAFTPNTIFVPKDSIPCEMEYGIHAFFRTFVLENGLSESFAYEARSQGYAEMFTYYDNGYSAIAENLQKYRDLSKWSLLIGGMAYIAILALFLILYPAQQSRTLAIMGSLGATRSMQIIHTVLNSLGILVPGSMLGAAIGIVIWDRVGNQLASNVALSVSIQTDIAIFASIATAQLILAITLVLGVSVLMTRSTSLLKRK